MNNKTNNPGKTYCATNDPAQGVPGPFVKPVEELVEAICGEMVCWSIVEPEATEEQKRDVWVYGKITTAHRKGISTSIYGPQFSKML